jgi:valyl-tRNA synthetase
MSKSKGNVLSPIDLGKEYGTDATRMAFIVGNPPGADMPLSEDKVRAYKKFANKLWNITRFVLDNTTDYTPGVPHTEADQQFEDTFLHPMIADINSEMERDRFDLAAEKIYHFVWTHFADEVIEASKPLLAASPDERASRQRLLAHYLVTSVKLLHPFMPFVTEAIWHELPQHMKDSDMLIVAKWPTGA